MQTLQKYMNIFRSCMVSQYIIFYLQSPLLFAWSRIDWFWSIWMWLAAFITVGYQFEVDNLPSWSVSHVNYPQQLVVTTVVQQTASTKLTVSYTLLHCNTALTWWVQKKLVWRNFNLAVNWLQLIPTISFLPLAINGKIYN